MTDEKNSEQGEVEEPVETAAERGEAGDEHAKREADTPETPAPAAEDAPAAPEAPAAEPVAEAEA
ncbi:MAG: hypothetical protein M3O89_11025, partial [Actinomycetota bacterium]|nr:hypothetical protein [Actinomycetota bacterium]